MMTKIGIIIVSFTFISALVIHDLTGKKMPNIKGKTIQGDIISPAFFKDKITLINFMYIGCPPCMKEIGILNHIHKHYKNTSFQILCIAANTSQQVLDFNTNDTTEYSRLRKRNKIDSIEYPILPECLTQISILKSGHLPSECTVVSKAFNVSGYPTSFLVDEKGIIRKVYEGYPTKISDSTIEASLQKDINQLLKE
jgi:peroxiredoxin